MANKLECLIVSEQFYPTSQRPFVVFCDDFEYYLCKHNCGSSNALFNEYIAASFIKIMGLSTPEFVFINVNYELFKNELIDKDLRKSYFDKLCFGSKMLNSIDLDYVIASTKAIQNKEELLKSILTIALFDIWIANDDRVYNNPNLIITYEQNKYILNLIDHEKIFNGNSESELYELSENSSILAHELVNTLYTNSVKSKLLDIISQIIDKFENDLENCKEKLDNILEITPVNWNIDILEKREFIINQLFDPEWIKRSLKSFRELVHFYLK